MSTIYFENVGWRTGAFAKITYMCFHDFVASYMESSVRNNCRLLKWKTLNNQMKKLKTYCHILFDYNLFVRLTKNRPCSII
jgi:hypothetical protein